MSLPETPRKKTSRPTKGAASPGKSRATTKASKGTAGVVELRHAKAQRDVTKEADQLREAPQDTAAGAAKLAQELERALADGKLDILPPQALQALMAALCKTYTAQIEAGAEFPLLADRNSVTSTDVMIACGALLKSANLQVFELGMWQSWTGR